ncbi:MAG: hypothetical protein F6K09_34870 [Merismopedia sp. SIO2A8]|nr:hypothetical protein [Merismopedia sp. SIO2A8]
MKLLYSTLSSCAIALLSSCAIALLQWPHLQKLTDSSAVVSQDALERQIEQESLRLNLWEQAPALGFNNLMANWTFLTFLQYFGDDEVRERTDYSLSPEYFEVILDKNPYFWDAYLFLPGSTTMYAARPDRTIEIMEKHLPKLSPKAPDRAYFIWRWKAVDELLFLDAAESAVMSHQTAADWASTYDTEEGQFIAQVSQQSAEFLRENPASKAMQVNAWMSVYGNALDDAARQLAIDRIRGLGGDVILDEEGNVVEVKTPQE